MKNILLLSFLFFAAMGFSQDKPIEVPKILIKVSLGETVQFQKASVKFLKVLEDSRCPSDVTCVWEGQAKVLVEVTETGKEPKHAELLYGKIKITTLFSSEGYMLQGISLSPYPTTDIMGKMDYSLLVSEEGN